MRLQELLLSRPFRFAKGVVCKIDVEGSAIVTCEPDIHATPSSVSQLVSSAEPISKDILLMQ